jgi:hypothetical protein
VRALALPLTLLAVAASACVDGVEVLDTQPEVAPGDVTWAAELWANDPLRRTVDLTTGEFGLVVEGGALKNQSSHLGFGVPNAGFLEVGIQASETGALVDLGPDADLAAALGTESGFVGIARRSGGGFGYGPADALFTELQSIEGGADGGAASRIVPEVGHVLVGAVVKRAGSPEAVDDALLVKILIIDHEPGRFLSIRWAVL